MILRRTNLLFSILCLNSKLEKLWGHKVVPVMSHTYLTSYFCLVRFANVRFIVIPFKPYLNKNVKVIPVFLSENWLSLIADQLKSEKNLTRRKKTFKDRNTTISFPLLFYVTAVNRRCNAWNWGSRKIAFVVPFDGYFKNSKLLRVSPDLLCQCIIIDYMKTWIIAWCAWIRLGFDW